MILFQADYLVHGGKYWEYNCIAKCCAMPAKTFITLCKLVLSACDVHFNPVGQYNCVHPYMFRILY